MAAARSQIAGFTSSSGTGNKSSTFTTNPAAGCKVLVAVWVNGATTPTVTDNASNTYTQDKTFTANGTTVAVLRADNVALPGSGTLSVTGNFAGDGAIQAIAYTGVAAGAPASTNNNSSASNVTTATSGAAGSASTAVHMAVVEINGFANPTNLVTSAPFTQQGAEQNGANLVGADSDQINALASQTCTWTWSTAGAPYTAAIVAYDGSGGGAVSVNPAIRDRAVKRRILR